MAGNYIDTNVLIRFLVETPDTIDDRFKGVFNFFDRIDSGEVEITITDLVVFETFFVLTSFYNVAPSEASDKLKQLLELKGIRYNNKNSMLECLTLLQKTNLDIVDAWLVTLTRNDGLDEIYSWDQDFKKAGLKLMDIQ